MLATLDENMMLGKRPAYGPSHGCWVAGGAIRRWFTGEPQTSDIDFFSPSDDAERQCLALITDKSPSFQNDKQATYKTHGQSVQFIKLRFATIEVCLDSFDFAHCQFAWDGEKIYATPPALIAACRKRLAVHKIQPGYEVDSLRRAMKYAATGFKPCNATVVALARSLIGANVETQLAAISVARWD